MDVFVLTVIRRLAQTYVITHADKSKQISCCVALTNEIFLRSRTWGNKVSVPTICRTHSLLKGWNKVSFVVFENQIGILNQILLILV